MLTTPVAERVLLSLTNPRRERLEPKLARDNTLISEPILEDPSDDTDPPKRVENPKMEA